ncbi:hypothetical protein DFH09DRAFT_857025, partial [Mycena vulgaris]
LDTNYPPLESDTFLISEAISKAQSKLARLDARITLLMPVMEQTFQERSNLEILILKHETTLSVLRRLPVELLSLIFEFANFRSPSTSPSWNLGQVCARWRGISLALPTLW